MPEVDAVIRINISSSSRSARRSTLVSDPRGRRACKRPWATLEAAIWPVQPERCTGWFPSVVRSGPPARVPEGESSGTRCSSPDPRPSTRSSRYCPPGGLEHTHHGPRKSKLLIWSERGHLTSCWGQKKWKTELTAKKVNSSTYQSSHLPPGPSLGSDPGPGLPRHIEVSGSPVMMYKGTATNLTTGVALLASLGKTMLRGAVGVRDRRDP